MLKKSQLKQSVSRLRLKSAFLHMSALLLVFAILFYAPPIQRLDTGFNDGALQNSVKFGSPDIVILEIDAETQDDFGNLSLSRDYFADVIENITKIHPQKILFDGILVLDGPEEHDQRLAIALERLGPEKIAIGGLNKTATTAEMLPKEQFRGASTVFGANFHPDATGMHRAISVGTSSADEGTEQTLVNPSRWLAGEQSTASVMIDQGIDPDSYIRLPISEFKGQADLDLINKTFVIGKAVETANSRVNYPTKNEISRATLIALGADTLMQESKIFKLDSTTIAKVLLALGGMAFVMVLALKTLKHVFLGAVAVSAAIVISSMIGLHFFDALMNITLMLVAWNASILAALAYKLKLAEIIYDFWKGDLSAEEAATWREWGASDRPLLLLGADKVKRINANARALGIMVDDHDTIDAICMTARALSADEAKAVAFALPGRKLVLSITKPQQSQSLIQLEDITEAPEASEAPDRVATVFEIDPLTKCQNKTGFTKAVRAVERRKEPFTIFKLEVSSYTIIRQTHGNQASDSVLVKAAQSFKNNLRNSDRLARLAENEFAILIEGAQSEDYLRTLQDTFEKSLGNRIQINGLVMAIGVHAGFAQSISGESYAEVFEAVDAAKQARKEQLKPNGRTVVPMERKVA